jgi:hypothetical protein
MADDRRPRKKISPGKSKASSTRPKRRAIKPEPDRPTDAADEDSLASATRALAELFKAGAAKKKAAATFLKPGVAPVDTACSLLIKLLRHHCPGALPADPLKPGEPVAPIPIEARDAKGLMTLAARQAIVEATGAGVPSDPARLPTSVLWQEGTDALLVDVAGIDVRIADGLVSVLIPVRCDQLPDGLDGRNIVEVDFVVGTPDRPTGLLAATTEPRGPRGVVRRWGNALTALGWQAMLDAIGGIAAAAGRDRDGATLIPTALTATGSGLAVIAQARHETDRLRPGRVVASPVRLGASRP